MRSGEVIYRALSIGGCVSARGIKETRVDEIEIGKHGRIPMALFTSHLPLKSGIGVERLMFNERDVIRDKEF